MTKVFNKQGQVITPTTQPTNAQKYGSLAPAFKLFPSQDGQGRAYGADDYNGAEITGAADKKQYAGNYEVHYLSSGAVKISSVDPDSTAGGAFEDTTVFATASTFVNATLTISASDGSVSIDAATIYYSIAGSDNNVDDPGNETGNISLVVGAHA